MKTQLPEAHLEAWRGYYVSFWRIITAVEADLEEAKLPSLSCYDALYELYLAPERHLRMSELARHALLSRSGLTRLVDKLEKDQLIERKACASDGRVQHAQLTDKGVEMLRRIWPVYRAGIAKYFAANLSEAEARAGARMFGKVLGGLEPECARLKARAGQAGGAPEVERDVPSR
ncbi:MAG TPA: MarR family transcriptional regulator [Opitutaceae bacterium]|nr:MarR family transcriptional regulator [Opitutaceae bacterium]